LAAPTRDAKTLLGCLRVALESRSPRAAVVTVAVTAVPERIRAAQLGLFVPPGPAPERLPPPPPPPGPPRAPGPTRAARGRRPPPPGPRGAGPLPPPGAAPPGPGRAPPLPPGGARPPPATPTRGLLGARRPLLRARERTRRTGGRGRGPVADRSGMVERAAVRA